MKKYLDFPPSLIAEVLSPATAFFDRHTKYFAYQEKDVPYCLIVSPETEETEVYVLENGAYQLKQKAVAFHQTFQLDGCKVIINFAEVWK